MVNLNSIRWREQTDGLLTLGRIIVGVVFGLLALSFWSLQIGQYDRLAEMAENNHDRTISLRAPRGALVDRNGNVLVDNRYTFNISVIRERVADLDSSLDLIGRVTGADVDALRAAVLDQRGVPAFRPIVIVPDASLAQVAAVQARAIELPGVIVEHDPARYYPSRKTASHLFGYVGEAQEHQLRDVSDPRVRLGAIIGQSGVEQSYNLLLMGENGARRVAVNNVGREIETIDQVSPRQGRQLRLTIDLDVQQAAEEAFAISGFDGAAVALDPRTGEVLALVSLPAYDPADFVPRVDQQTWSTLNSDARRPLQNRVLQGRYAPGSTFKVAMAVAALEEGAITPDFSVNCAGGARFYQRFFRCHTRHGRVALHEALEKSCNTYFYTLGSMLDIDRIHHWAAALGLGEPSGIDLPHEVPGLVPSRAWKRLQFNQPWYPGETLSVAIGQGAVSVTPVSLAVMMSTVASGGLRPVPHMLQAVRSGNGWVAADQPAPQRVGLKPETVAAVREGLWMAVNRAGTARRARITGRDVIGKTGTAQVISLEGLAAVKAEGDSGRRFRDHGWFVFAAPQDDPRIAGVVFGEHAEHGYLAAPIAKAMIEAYFAKHDEPEGERPNGA
ncbi:MAG: penicillin-binding protein 2 [Acidobacteria bacterium]|nr:penicillin-binding protein 2 [Acidobacteriota bacterium]